MSNDRAQLQALGEGYWEKAYARDLAAYQKLCNEQLEEIRRLRELLKSQSEGDPEAWKLECGT